MASIATVPFTLGPIPSGYTKPTSTSKVSKPVELPVYPAGPSFISSARRQILQRTFEQDDKAVLASREAQAKLQNTSGEGDLYPGLGEEQEDAATLASDPKEWKKQDHYAVLGLGNLRYIATEDHIRVAREPAFAHRKRLSCAADPVDRRKVLRHHPDKKAGGGGGANDDAFFKCIQKGQPILNH